MNAKFEKWYVERYGYQPRKLITARTAWQAAIQSLEVTPEIRRIAYETFCKSVPKLCLSKKNTKALYVAVEAILSALKEQAK